MALDPLNSSNLEQLALKGLKVDARNQTRNTHTNNELMEMKLKIVDKS